MAADQVSRAGFVHRGRIIYCLRYVTATGTGNGCAPFLSLWMKWNAVAGLRGMAEDLTRSAETDVSAAPANVTESLAADWTNGLDRGRNWVRRGLERRLAVRICGARTSRQWVRDAARRCRCF